MTDPLHQQLLGHLLGALDDDEHKGLDSRLERDEECCQELVRWRQRLAPLEAMRPDFEPPAGLAERTCRYVATSKPILEMLHSSPTRQRMSSRPAPLNRDTRIGLFDMVTLAMVMAVAAGLIVSAIDAGRAQLQLAARQDGPRPSEPLGGRANASGMPVILSEAKNLSGLAAANEILRYDQNDNVRLVAQGMPAGPSRGVNQLGSLSISPTNVRLLRGLQWRGIQVGDEAYSDWPGTWRNGTTAGWRNLPSPAEVAILTDAPSANLPGQDVADRPAGAGEVLSEDDGLNSLSYAMPTYTTGGRLIGSLIQANAASTRTARAGGR
jgi:hypothetical protein